MDRPTKRVQPMNHDEIIEALRYIPEVYQFDFLMNIDLEYVYNIARRFDIPIYAKTGSLTTPPRPTDEIVTEITTKLRLDT